MDLHEEGNRLVAAGDHEAAVGAYSRALRALEDEGARLKVLANRGLCHLKLRNYCDASEDLNRAVDGLVVTSAFAPEKRDKLLCKTLVRRAMCFEYMAEFPKALRDLEAVAATDPGVLRDKAVRDLRSRVRASLQSDASAAKLEPQPNYLVTEAQTLRLNFLAEPPRAVSEGRIFHCKVCLGNEFGLFSRLFYCGEREKLRLSVDDSEDAELSAPPGSDAVLGQILVEAFDLDEQCGLRLVSPQTDALLFDVGVDGKAAMDLTLEPCGPRTADAHVILRFSLGSHRLRAGMDAVLPLLSLPILVRGALSTEDTLPDDTVRAVAQRVHASCIRTLVVPASDPVFVLESAGLLGIGGKVWDSSFALTQFLGRHSAVHVTGKRVLELGSGTGITGLFLAQFAPMRVVMTDLPDVVPLLEANIALNGSLVKALEVRDVLRERYCGMELSWGAPLPPAVAEVSWNTIIASDVVYAPEYYGPLHQSLRHLLVQTVSGTCILAHRHRHPEDSKFFALVTSDADLHMEEIWWKEEGTPLKAMDIRLFSITRCKIGQETVS